MSPPASAPASVLAALGAQHDIAWKLTRYHLTGLTDAHLAWRPAAGVAIRSHTGRATGATTATASPATSLETGPASDTPDDGPTNPMTTPETGDGLHVHRTAAGHWQVDWPEHEGYDLGPPSIAWILWHLMFWQSMVLDHSFGEATLTRAQVPWPGSAQAVCETAEALTAQWRERLAALSDGDLEHTALTRWPYQGRPFRDVVAWVNLELMKSGAELGYARFLYGA